MKQEMRLCIHDWKLPGRDPSRTTEYEVVT